MYVLTGSIVWEAVRTNGKIQTINNSQHGFMHQNKIVESKNIHNKNGKEMSNNLRLSIIKHKIKQTKRRQGQNNSTKPASFSTFLKV